ncbi:hypothetical protein J1N35_000681 [Gossypium stocksii]|uniref:Reverse transcriptase domain-containing protein n=1 Tax=Gossypium stocksii TaxID=47602 RepID=A0A9D4AL05_9ROSI|nr:hypothetical protein J1N35_000681 [Gossypium stocksii]
MIRGLFRADIYRLQKSRGELCDVVPHDTVLEEIVLTKMHLNMKIDKEERYWEHRIRVNWLHYGGRNTAFFHRSASQHQQVNTVTQLDDMEGNTVMGMDAIEKAYDPVEWHLVQEVMLKMGFDGTWVDLIMHCVQTVRQQITFAKSLIYFSANVRPDLQAAMKGTLGVRSTSSPGKYLGVRSTSSPGKYLVLIRGVRVSFNHLIDKYSVSGSVLVHFSSD